MFNSVFQFNVYNRIFSQRPTPPEKTLQDYTDSKIKENILLAYIKAKNSLEIHQICNNQNPKFKKLNGTFVENVKAYTVTLS